MNPNGDTPYSSMRTLSVTGDEATLSDVLDVLHNEILRVTSTDAPELTGTDVVGGGVTTNGERAFFRSFDRDYDLAVASITAVQVVAHHDDDYNMVL